MALKTVNQIRVELSQIQASHLQINSFFWGDFLRAYKESQLNYPLMGAFYPKGSMLQRQNQIELVIYVADKILKDWSNLNDVESDTLQYCRDIYRTINDSVRWKSIGRVQSCTFTKFVDRGGDEVAGHQMTIQFLVRDIGGVCGMPMGDYDFDQTTGGCLPALYDIVDSEGNQLYSGQIASGGDLTQPIQDSTVTNSNATYNASVNAEGSLVLPDTTDVIKDSAGNILHTNVIPSATSDIQVIADSVAVIKSSLGNILFTENILAEATEDIIALNAVVDNSDLSYTLYAPSGENSALPDENITVNGTALLTKPSVQDIDITLNNLDGSEAGFTSAGSVITLTDEWVRPSDWLEIDSLVNIGDHRFVGLMAIFDETVAGNPKNYQTIRSSQAYTVEIDGVATNYGAGVLCQIAITYASINISTLTSEGFKQSIIEVYPQVGTWTGDLRFDIARTTAPTAYNSQFIDIRLSAPNISLYGQTNASVRQVYLKKHVYLGTHLNFSRAGQFGFAVSMEYVSEDYANATSMGNYFLNAKAPRDIGDIIAPVATSATTMFYLNSGLNSIGNITINSAITTTTMCQGNTTLTSIGNISLASSTSASSLLFSNAMLATVGTVNIPLATTMFQFVYNCTALTTLGNITTGAGLTILTTAFYQCRKLLGVNISNCSGVTTTTTALTECVSLTSLILTGLTRGITVPPCNMDEQAFIDFFNSLGTASGAQTIVITGNITLLASTLLIATGKGFTVTP